MMSAMNPMLTSRNATFGSAKPWKRDSLRDMWNGTTSFPGQMLERGGWLRR